MATTGMFLMVFLLLHLTVNIFLFYGEKAFNDAVLFMRSNIIIKILEYVLVIGFLIHIIMGIKLHFQNKNITVGYDYEIYSPYFLTSFSSRSMIYTGILILCFLILHLINFMIPMKYYTYSKISDYYLVVKLFKNPVYTTIYVLSFIILGIHLNHGFQSSFKSLGISSNNNRIIWIQRLGFIYFFIICSGFSIIAIWFFLNGN